jgi:mono/diheme cytochrome c family protein
MRHFFAYVATYTIAVLLIGGAALFAWMRSAQLALTHERTILAQFEPARTDAFEWEALGARSYERNCANCHGRDGEGWDQYPGLGHTARLFAASNGRDYVVDLHLYGLTSRRWRAPMPPMGHIQDVEMAAVLNHLLTHFGNQRDLPPGATLYGPSDVTARRGARLSPWDVEARRPALDWPGAERGGSLR